MWKTKCLANIGRGEKGLKFQVVSTPLTLSLNLITIFFHNKEVKTYNGFHDWLVVLPSLAERELQYLFFEWSSFYTKAL